MKKIISLLLSVFMILSTISPLSVTAEIDSPTITVGSVTDVAGSTVIIPVTVENNPGILGATLQLTYDEGLTLVDATNGDAFSVLDLTKPQTYDSPCKFVWDELDVAPEDVKDGTILNLEFAVSENAISGKEYKIGLSYSKNSIVDRDLNSIDVTIVNGSINVINYIPGDLDGDNDVNTRDAILLRRYLADYPLNINKAAADVNADGDITTADSILIRRYLAGWEVILLPSPLKPQCMHEMIETKYKTPTCTENGNSNYWHCTICDKYYLDSNGVTETTLEDTVIAAMGHTAVTDPAVEPTYEKEGLTEGSHCSICATVITPQLPIPPLEKDDYSITYHIANNDTYLASIGIANPNPSVYYSQDGLILEDLIVPGYNFMGWYDSQTGGTRITEIKKNETGNKVLYAHWEKTKYTIQFMCDMVPVSSITYTAGQEVALPQPVLDKYIFLGWSDKKTDKTTGKITENLWNTLPAGTIGDFVFYANWASDRNRAVAKNKLDEPLVFEDTDKGEILFTYEIGEIRNVPLYETLQLQCVNGIITEESVSNQTHISNENAQNVAKAISTSTTKSAAWTLSSDWNKSTEVSESYLDKIQESREEAEIKAKTNNNTYNLLSTSSGSSNSINTNDGSFRYSANEAHRDYSKIDTTSAYELTTNDKLNTEISAEVSAGYGPVKASVGGKIATETSVGESYGDKIETSNVGTNAWENSLDVSENYSNTVTDAKSWSTESAYSSSTQTSQTNSVSTVLSKEIATTKHHGESYSEGGSKSDSQAFESSEAQNNEYSSTVTFHTAEIETKTKKFTSTGNTVGNYRMIQAGTMHVYGVVGYNIAEKNYFVYTYNVLDDETHEYLDYSRDGSFDDYEISTIPFEIPYYVNEYVNNKIAKTDGLKLQTSTGMITGYTPKGERPDNIVVIPSYMSVANNDGTFKSVKVTGIAPGLFENNTDITAVQLGKFITEIPDNTFAGCTSLKYVLAPGVTSIGNNAFAGCTSLTEFTVPEEITALGENAFEGVPAINVTASNASVAQAAAGSGAQSITLDISRIPVKESADMRFEVTSADSFILQGKNKSYKGLSIKSDTTTTIINGITFTDNKDIPLELSSENVTLDKVTIDCSGYALVLKAPETNLLLNEVVNLISSSENAVLSRSVILQELSSDFTGEINITGNMLVSGTVNENNLMKFNSGQIIYITDEEYENYLTSRNINFEINYEGGTNPESKPIPMNMAIGELPVPRRDYYTFGGWYTEAEGGEQITAETVMNSLSDITVYAHWEQNDVSAWTLAAEVPADAEIVDQKWTYTLTSYTTSGSSSLSGWEKYDTTWAWSAWGNWSDWLNYDPGSSDSREKQSESRSEWIDTSHNEDRWYYYHWCSPKGSTYLYTYNPGGYTFHEVNLSYEMGISRYGSGGSVPEYGDYWCASGYSPYWFRGGYAGDGHAYKNQVWVSSGYTNYYTVWRYRDRSKVYTYHYKKNENKESSEYPTGDNISDVQEYVQYRVK